MPNERHLVSCAEAAQHFGVSYETIRNWIANGTINGYRIGPRVVRVDLLEIENGLKKIPAVTK